MSARPPSLLSKFLQDTNKSDQSRQFRDLLPSLKSSPGWLNGTIYQYSGFWFTPTNIQALLEYQNHFQARDSDIFIVTVPKAGTTWVKAILFALTKRDLYHPRSDRHPLLTKNPHDLITWIENEINLNAEKKLPDFSTLESPRLFSTHVPYTLLPESIRSSNCKIVYLCRDPRDVFVSLWHFVNKVRQDWLGPLALDEALDYFCDGVSIAGPYWDTVLLHWKESVENSRKVMFLKYEEIKRQPGAVVRKLTEFVGSPFSSDEESNGVVEDIIGLCSFKKLNSLEVNQTETMKLGVKGSAFFRRGKVGDWVNFLDPEMGDRIDRITQEKFEGIGLKF